MRHHLGKMDVTNYFCHIPVAHISSDSKGGWELCVGGAQLQVCFSLFCLLFMHLFLGTVYAGIWRHLFGTADTTPSLSSCFLILSNKHSSYLVVFAWPSKKKIPVAFVFDSSLWLQYLVCEDVALLVIKFQCLLFGTYFGKAAFLTVSKKRQKRKNK